MSSAYEAGPQLDAVIAEKVMGWKIAGESVAMLRFVSMGDTLHPHNVPRYSTDIAAAWTVVDKVMERAFGVWLACTHEAGWRCDFKIDSIAQVTSGFDTKSAPLAICRAALAAKGIHA